MVFDAISGFHQAGFLVGALLFLGIGVAALADFIHWRLHARGCFGEIVALRASRKKRTNKKGSSQCVYFPIVELGGTPVANLAES